MRNFNDLQRSGNQTQILRSARQNNRLRLLYAGGDNFSHFDNFHLETLSHADIVAWLQKHVVSHFKAETGFEVTIDCIDLAKGSAAQANQLGDYMVQHMHHAYTDAGVVLIAPRFNMPYNLSALAYGLTHLNVPVIGMDMVDYAINDALREAQMTHSISAALMHVAILRGYPFFGIHDSGMRGVMSVFDAVPRLDSGYDARYDRLLMDDSGLVREDLLPESGGLDLVSEHKLRQDGELVIETLCDAPFQRERFMRVVLEKEPHAILIPVETDDLSFLYGEEMLGLLKQAEEKLTLVIPVLTSRNGFLVKPEREWGDVRPELPDNVLYPGAMTVPAVIAKLRMITHGLSEEMRSGGGHDMALCLDHLGRGISQTNNRLPEARDKTHHSGDLQSFLKHARRRTYAHIRTIFESRFNADMGNMPLMAPPVRAAVDSTLSRHI